jgi:hypothetical protein
MSALAPVPQGHDPVERATGKIAAVWARWLHELKKRAEDAAGPGGVINAAQITSGTLPLARLANIANAQIAAAAAIAWSKLDKAGSSLADLAMRSAGDLSSGTLPDGRFPATLPAVSGANLTNLDASDLASGAVAVARLSNGVTTAITSTATGTQNNWAPGLVGDTLISWSGASDLTVTGFAGGVSGQRIVFLNTGSAVAYFAHQSGSSSAGNKLRNFATGGSTPVAARGALVYHYDGNDWRLVAHEQGAFISIAHNAANFTGLNAMTWTVDSADQVGYAYKMVGSDLIVTFQIDGTDVGGTADLALQVAIPGGFTATRLFMAVATVNDAGGGQALGLAQVSTGASVIQIAKNPLANFTLTTADNTNIRATIRFEVS